MKKKINKHIIYNLNNVNLTRYYDSALISIEIRYCTFSDINEHLYLRY